LSCSASFLLHRSFSRKWNRVFSPFLKRKFVSYAEIPKSLIDFSSEELEKDIRLGGENPELEIISNFITDEEHNSIVEEVDIALQRKRYERKHWDQVINGFREMEKTTWSPSNWSVIERVKSHFPSSTKWLAGVHILDLSEGGVIGPHIDNVKVGCIRKVFL